MATYYKNGQYDPGSDPRPFSALTDPNEIAIRSGKAPASAKPAPSVPSGVNYNPATNISTTGITSIPKPLPPEAYAATPTGYSWKGYSGEGSDYINKLGAPVFLSKVDPKSQFLTAKQRDDYDNWKSGKTPPPVFKPETGNASSPSTSPISGLTKVATGSVGPDGKPIYDVFANGQHIADPSDPRLKGVDIASLPGGEAPAGFASKFLPSSPVSDTTETRTKIEGTGKEIAAKNEEAKVPLPPDAISETTQEIIKGIQDRQKQLKDEATAEKTRIESEFATATEEVKFAQEQERKKKEEKTFYKGYVFQSEIEELTQLDRQHRMESAALLSKKNSALAAASKAYNTQDFQLAQSLLTTAKAIEDNQYKKEQDYFDNTIKLQEHYEKLNKPLRDLEKAEQDQVLEWMEKAPEAFSDVEPIDLEMGTFSYGEARAKWIQSDAYKLELRGTKADVVRKEQLAGGGGEEPIEISSTDKTKLLGAGFLVSEINSIQSDINQYGIDAVLEGIDDPTQKKAIQDAYGVEEKVTKDKVKSIVESNILSKGFSVADALESYYSEEELNEFAKESGFRSIWSKRNTERANYLKSDKAKEKYIDLLYQQYKDAGLTED